MELRLLAHFIPHRVSARSAACSGGVGDGDDSAPGAPRLRECRGNGGRKGWGVGPFYPAGGGVCVAVAMCQGISSASLLIGWPAAILVRMSVR